ncbi:MAG: histidine phosphatase family protein [Planctomycetes bacterium]|nr:histidine phosphatase family protein [Planctomycetota bacterium]
MLADPETCARLILVRHPEIDDPERGQAIGVGDATLSRRGMQQTVEVIRTLANLTIDEVHASPARHCLDAATAIARDRGLDAVPSESLRGQNLGSWEGKAWTELHADSEALVREFFGAYGAFAPPGGETLSDAVDRALGYWSEIVERLEGKSVVFVAAAPLLGGLAARMLGLGLGRAPALNLAPAAVGILDVFRDGAAVRTWHPNALRDDLP